MKKFSILFLAALLCAPSFVLAQAKPSGKDQQKKSGAQTTAQQPATAGQQPRSAPPAGLTDYGIEIGPDARLIVMMAALDAAGWDPTPAGERPSVFRELLRKDQAALDPILRKRMRDFYERHALKNVEDNPATPQDESVRYTPAEQSARYVSLAYALGQPPAFEAPPRSEDLPGGVLDVLDFVPLLREFYKQSGMDARLNGYLQMHRAAGDALRAPTVDMARVVLAYLNTRPETVAVERVVSKTPVLQVGKKKRDDKEIVVNQEHERRFRIVPDLLADPGSINFRAVGDNYYAIVPADTDPRLSEMRRAYVQFIIDPLVARFNRDVSARRDDIKQLLEHERARKGTDLSPDIFLTVARSLVAAADVRLDETLRLRVLQIETSQKLQQARDQAAKDAALKESKERESAIEDFATVQLADAYEHGAVLSFHFAEELRGFEGSGFDIANFITPMLADFKPEREMSRPSEYAAVVRARETRRRAFEDAKKNAAPADEQRAALLKSLRDVDDLLRVHNYEEAQTRLTALREQHHEEPLVYFELGQTASLSAQDAFDENLQAERLNTALAHFRQAILFSTPETDPSVPLRSHLASGRILAHLERRDEAAREFDAVIASSDPANSLHREAVAEKKKLTGQ